MEDNIKKDSRFYKCISWAKTLMEIYPSLKNRLKSIDNKILSIAQHSAPFDVMNTFDKLVYNFELKQNTLLLKQFVELILKKLKNSKKGQMLYNIIEDRYFLRLDYKKIIEKENISVRTLYRKLQKAELIIGDAIVKSMSKNNKIKTLLCADFISQEFNYKYKVIINYNLKNKNEGECYGK